MPFHIYKKLFPSTTVDQLAATKGAKIKLKIYNPTTITQLGRCKVKIGNNNKCKTCIFFVVPGDGETLLGMPDIELLNVFYKRSWKMHLMAYGVLMEHFHCR